MNKMMLLKNLFVKHEKTITFHDIDTNISVYQLKILILQKLGWTENILDRIRLIYSSKILDDNKCLKDYSLENESTIMLYMSLN